MKTLKYSAIFLIWTATIISFPISVAAQSVTQVEEWSQKGMKAWEDGRYTDALLPLLQAVEAGNADAQTYLGRMYRDGTGVQADTARAVDLFQKAAEQGQTSAMVSLGTQYRLGTYLKQDYQEAVKWFSKSAKLGYPSGQNNLAKMYLEGWGVPQSYKQAVEWYQKAANQGDVYAQSNLGYRYMNGEGVPQDIIKARNWFQKAVNGGHPRAKDNLEKLTRVLDYEQQEKVIIPVYKWSNPSTSLVDKMQNDGTYVHFNSKNFTPFITEEELNTFRKGNNTRDIKLIDNGNYTVLQHQPETGYSEWTFPDFTIPKMSGKDETHKYWRSFKIDFKIPNETSLADYEIPMQLRTSLSPTNKIEIDISNKGQIRIKTDDGSGSEWQYVSSINKAISAEHRTTVEIIFSSLGDWIIYVNDKYFESGKIDAQYVIKGLSNKCWFEGSLHIYDLTIKEIYNNEDFDLVTGLIETELNILDDKLAQTLGRYTGFYNTDGPQNRLALLDWKYENHERTYTRRMSVDRLYADYEKGMFSTRENEEEKYTAYRINLIVKGNYEGNQSISIPLQYEVMIDESDKSLQGINLFFNESKNRYVLLEKDIKELLPNYVKNERVILSEGSNKGK